MSFWYKCLFVLITVFFAFTSLGTADSTTILSDNFDTFENMLKSSDAIIVGSVVNSSMKRVQYNFKEKIFRCSEIAVERIVYSKVKNVPSSIVIETYEGDYYNDRIQGIALEPPTFVPGHKFIALLQVDKNDFRLIYDSCGKIDIENDVVVYCKEPLELYLSKIKDFIVGKTVSFEGRTYGLYAAYKPHSEENIHVGKSAQTAELLANNLYYLGSTAYFHPLPLSASSQINMQFRINPTGAKDADSLAIPFNTLKTLITNAFNAWHNIDDTNITFTVHPDSFPTTWQSNTDGLHTVTFETGPAWADYVTADGDIRFNPNKLWVLPGQSGDGPKLYRTLAHELGHAVGIGDMGNNCDSPPYCHHGDFANTTDARYNLMWHTGATLVAGIESPQDGDKAGAVYCVPNPSGTLQFSEVWSGFAETGQPLTINSNVTVPQGKTLEIASNSIIKFASGVYLIVYGTLIIDPHISGPDDIKFTSTGAGTYWGGIYIKSGGVMDVTGPITIEYANTGIYIENTNGLSNDNYKITIKNCVNGGSGVYVSGCSPTFNRISVTNTYSSGIVIVGSSSAPVIHDCDFLGSIIGISLSNYADADVYLCKIQSEHYGIYMEGTTSLYMDNDGGFGHNTIDTPDGWWVIRNLPENGNIFAEKNYWGGTPSASMFTNPAYVDYDSCLASAYPGVGTGKVVAAQGGVSFPAAYQLERERRWTEAAGMYLTLFSASDDVRQKRRALKALIRVEDRSEKNYRAIRALIEAELSKADTKDIYRAALDQISCDLNMREGNYEKAIAGFLACAEKYRGTSIEAEMLARAAEVYGGYLGDKSKAKEYADRAAAINPGQPSLRFAYLDAGVSYDPSQYENVFAEKADHFENPPEPKTAAADEYVTISPNPANPITTIVYSIRNPSDVKLTIYSIVGQKVATLVDGPMSAGKHSVMFDGSRLASGVYLYRFESRGLNRTGKMLLLK